MSKQQPEPTAASASVTPAWDGVTQVVVDDAPAYDATKSLWAVAQPRSVPRGPWRAWGEATASALRVEQWRRLRTWFGESAIGPALDALIPLLAGQRDLAALAEALAALPLGDLLRLMVTAELIAPQTPLDTPDLLALQGDTPAARSFCDHYLRVTGRGRTVMLRALVAPEEARAELVTTLREHDEQVFAALAPQLTEERQRAVAALRAQVAREGGAVPAFLRERDDLAGFSPVVLGVSTILGDHLSLYYHDIDRSLFDGRAYEPLIAIVGARKALGLAPRRQRGAQVGAAADRLADPAARWATIFSALGDPSRVQIVRLLAEQPRYGQELAAALGMSGATISHHLDALAKTGALRMERRAHRTYFALDQAELRALLRQGEQYALGAPETTDTANTANTAQTAQSGEGSA